MPNAPIGISFMPTADAQADGQRRASMEGDLGQAFKILSLRLPRQPSVRGIAPQGLLNGAGMAGQMGGQSGFNPYEAVFRALVQSAGSGMQQPQMQSLTPSITPGVRPGPTVDIPRVDTSGAQALPTTSTNDIGATSVRNRMQDKYDWNQSGY